MKNSFLRSSLLLASLALMMGARQDDKFDAQAIVSRFHSSGSFEIYAMPNKFNMIADDEISFPGWVSHIPVQGKILEAAHRGTDHNTIHDYDTHVPLVFWGPNHVKKGQSDNQVSILDIVPTLAGILNVTPPPRPLAAL